jgi:hypothetical protein
MLPSGIFAAEGDAMKMEMLNQIAHVETAKYRWNRVHRISGAAALILGGLFLVALINLLTSSIEPGIENGWFSPFQNNWLLVLFQLNAGLNGVQFDLLSVLNPLDLAILALVATMYLGLYAALEKTSRILSLIAAIQPFLGIVLFVATKMAGRSGVMGAGLVISLVMLRSNIFGKVIALVGILASVLLLIGDLSTTPDSHSSIVAMLVAIGYVLLTAWFFLIARKLFQLGHR